MTAGADGGIVIRGCRALLGDDASWTPEPVDIVVRAREIAAIVPGGTAPPADTEIDGSRRLIVAGTINGHQHSHEHYQKGRIENLPLEIWTHYVRSPKPIPLTSRQVYLRTLIGAIEALRSGCTTMVDDCSLGAALPREHLAAIHLAYEDVGVRALVGFAMLDRPVREHFPFVADECPSEALALLDAIPLPRREALLELCEDQARSRHPRQHRVGFVVAPSAPQRCTVAFLQRLRAIADAHRLPVIIHVQETRLQVVTGARFYGRTMIEHLGAIGFLSPATSLIHAVWLNPREIELLARTGTTAQHNPWSNLLLGSGVQPVRDLLDAGVNVSLGSDGTASTMTTNMQTVIASAASIGKVRHQDFERWVGAKEIWRAATLGGAVALGMGDLLGSVAVGKVADLVGYRLDAIPFVPLNDALTQLVYAERGGDVDLVLVDGAIVMRDGRLSGIDEAAIIEEIADEHAKLAPLFAEGERLIGPIRESMARIYRRSLDEPVAPDTYPGWFGRAND